jgi:hypothetical protein
MRSNLTVLVLIVGSFLLVASALREERTAGVEIDRYALR